jgi:hypothetical protein
MWRVCRLTALVQMKGMILNPWLQGQAEHEDPSNLSGSLRALVSEQTN